MEGQLLVGEILKPQGIRGEVKCKPFTDGAEDFRSFRKVLIDGEEYRILSVRTGDGAVYLGLRGVVDRNAAEALRGKKLYVLREDAPEPEEGSYYIVDLLGSEVFTQEGERLGELTDIRQASTDVYTLRSGEKEILFPAAAGVILTVDVEGKRIEVDKKRFFEVAVF